MPGIILNGRGPRVLLGFDLGGLRPPPRHDGAGDKKVQRDMAMQQEYRLGLPRRRALTQPIVPQFNGPAAGVGMARGGRDIRVAATSARFSTPHFLQLGLSARRDGHSAFSGSPRVVAPAVARNHGSRSFRRC